MPLRTRIDADPVLTNAQQYRADLARLPRLTHEQERALVDRTRAGDHQAREALLLSLLSGVECLACRYFHAYASAWKRLEYLDLIQEGNLALLRHLDGALEGTDNPCAYLLAMAQGAIRHYCFEHRSCIRTPQSRDVTTPIPVESLDACLAQEDAETALGLFAAPEPSSEEDEATPQTPTLLGAIDRLPKMQRTVLLRHYGLDGAPAEAMGDIERDLYGTRCYQGKRRRQGGKHVWRHRHLALRALQHTLAPHYPHYAEGSSSA